MKRVLMISRSTTKEVEGSVVRNTVTAIDNNGKLEVKGTQVATRIESTVDDAYNQALTNRMIELVNNNAKKERMRLQAMNNAIPKKQSLLKRILGGR